jgi:hypothetical protein
MSQSKFKTAYVLSAIIVALSLIASAGGLLLNGLYRDNAFVKTTWLGNDAVTLLIAVPILVVALVFSNRGSLRTQLIWVGMLDYMLYNYAFYLFGSAFNWFFLIYVALVGLSIFALIFGLANLDVNGISQKFRERTPVKWIGGYFLFVVFGLGVVYLKQSIDFILTGQLPAIVTRSGHITNVVFALDLTMVIPWLALGAIWLIQRKPWGYVIAGILSIKAPLYTLILTVNTLLVVKAGLGGADELPLWAMLTVLGSIAGALLYENMRTTSKE